MDLGKEFHPASKPNYNRRTPKRVNRGKFSAKIIQEILERDGYKCVKCGSYHLEKVPHHCQFKSQGGDNSKRNGVSICLKCHREAHSKREVREWFERYAEERFDENGDKKELS